MTLSLPPVVGFRQDCRHENGWSDHYGAIQVAAAYAGLSLPERNLVRGIWQHGCFAPWQDGSPELLTFNAPITRQVPVRVARQDQAELLIRAGYENVQAIGLPMVYTPDRSVVRMPDSLLVVPTHTLVGDKFPDRSLFERYADEIKAAAGWFRQVIVCIHPNCRRNNLWIKEFSDRGIEMVLGAQTNDCNALLRMRTLFEQFEYVTTNGWGSHVAYALAFGAKVSIQGTLPERTAADLLRDLTWAADPEAVKRELSEETAARKRDYLRELFRPPHEGTANVATGRWLIGADHQLLPAEMKACLGQLLDPRPPATEAGTQAREHRRQIRTQAGGLVAAGRKQEAAQLLLRFMRTAVDTKDARFIHESLLEVAADLAAIDPVRSQALRVQADTLGARLPRATAA